ncbi:MAG: hypothetical protein VX772_06995 [Bacteroidota bacterium]|uniref:Uncharacterized protein n=1 Tax=Flagellimonas okinawensis TaxID=3031324 RepID=A0ABT5XIF9_9FLAO|nr:hypothetical protein [[Muricauda] okinawensis]MDF0705674.1 hypothetical protein [[Muricauda] okinawensis]MEC8832088.1 hypothetical protein [Bacteroidota bacterium]
MSSIKFLYLFIFSISLFQAKTVDDGYNVEQKFPKHWHEVSTINGEQVIFIPCDYQNTEFIIESTNGENKFTEVTGQDGWVNVLEEIVPIDDKTTKITVTRPDDVQITFMVTEISSYLYNWTWEEKDYDGSMVEYSINMVPEEYKDQFKVVEEPPCM